MTPNWSLSIHSQILVATTTGIARGTSSSPRRAAAGIISLSSSAIAGPRAVSIATEMTVNTSVFLTAAHQVEVVDDLDEVVETDHGIDRRVVQIGVGEGKEGPAERPDGDQEDDGDHGNQKQPCGPVIAAGKFVQRSWFVRLRQSSGRRAEENAIAIGGKRKGQASVKSRPTGRPVRSGAGAFATRITQTVSSVIRQ